MAKREPDTVILDVSTCSHGVKNDGGFRGVPEGASFTFPACGRKHVATRDKYNLDPQYVEDQERLEIMRARAAHARAVRDQNK